MHPPSLTIAGPFPLPPFPLLLFQDSCCVLETPTGLSLKGGWYRSVQQGVPVLLFAGSPRVKNLGELEVGGL